MIENGKDVAKEQDNPLFINQHILKEVRTRQKNVAIAGINLKRPKIWSLKVELAAGRQILPEVKI